MRPITGAPLYPEALIGGRVSWTPGGAIRFCEFELEGLMSFRDVVAPWIWGKQIRPVRATVLTRPRPSARSHRSSVCRKWQFKRRVSHTLVRASVP